MTCPDCIHSVMVDSYRDGPALMCGWFNVKASPLTAQDCPQFERCAGADGIESPAHKIWYVDGRGD